MRPKVNKLRILRARSGLTILQLAALAGVDASTISFIENGRKIPRVDTLSKIAGALGEPVEELLTLLGDVEPIEPITPNQKNSNPPLGRVAAIELLGRGGKMKGHFTDRLTNETFCGKALPEAANYHQLAEVEVHCEKCLNVAVRRGALFGQPAPAPETATAADLERLEEGFNAGRGITRQKSA